MIVVMNREMNGARRSGARGAAYGLALVLVGGLCSAAPASAGTVVPHSPPVPSAPAAFKLGSPKSSTYSVQRGGRFQAQFVVELRVYSQGDEAVTITGIGRSGQGLKLVSREARDPYVLQPGRNVDFSLRYEVTSCKAVQKGDWPVPVRMQSDEGEKIIYLPLQLSGKGATASWQAALAAQACEAS
ncbi:hypothetical protein ACQPYK_04715 [Streptosporangium sp. CA-135522]|uniref:hypothetical protein n=1 Tax=Streptosporangium sp. CA-135522 TaxID=3240072 RepID=UPI003D8E92FD